MAQSVHAVAGATAKLPLGQAAQLTWLYLVLIWPCGQCSHAPLMPPTMKRPGTQALVGNGVGYGVGNGVGYGVGNGVGNGVGYGVGNGVGYGVGYGVGNGVGNGVGTDTHCEYPVLPSVHCVRVQSTHSAC